MATDTKNYKLIYDMKGYDTNTHANIRTGLRSQADKKADEIHEKYMTALSRATGIHREELVQSSVGCICNGIVAHVYKKSDRHKTCLFCGIPDFDD